ncbi:MAG TPA: FkbM family methyltransferase [Steroidobacteraceae bacterium]|nr:FkbM family methyltransferase [Steroidobacteraceae bacterium]
MALSLSKLLRTLQSEFRYLKGMKDSAYYHYRKLRSKPHEDDFLALRFIPDDLPGSYVDVGANHGQSIESIKAIKSGARVFSFEANGMLAARLIERYRGREDITVFAFGLADEEQQRTLYVPSYKGFVYDGIASFDRASAADWLSPHTLYWFSPKKLVLHETTCTIRRLDDQNLQPVLIKIDVQGYEYQVIKGGIETIKRHEPILLIEDFHWEREMGVLLAGLGYEQYLFDENGFYARRDDTVINKFLMTPRRAATVKISTQPK